MRFLIIMLAVVAINRSPALFAFDGPLRVLPPSGWTLTYHGEDGVSSYSTTPAKKNSGLLMVSKWPAFWTKESEFVRKWADKLLKRSKEISEMTLITEKCDIQQFAGDRCNGSYFVIEYKNSGGEMSVLTGVMMTVDGQVWKGQFTGRPDDWAKALKLLTTLKKNG